MAGTKAVANTIWGGGIILNEGVILNKNRSKIYLRYDI